MAWTILVVLIQLMILATLWGILMAMKHGFNQVIVGLEALDRSAVRTAEGRSDAERGS